MACEKLDQFRAGMAKVAGWCRESVRMDVATTMRVLDSVGFMLDE